MRSKRSRMQESLYLPQFLLVRHAHSLDKVREGGWWLSHTHSEGTLQRHRHPNALSPRFHLGSRHGLVLAQEHPGNPIPLLLGGVKKAVFFTWFLLVYCALFTVTGALLWVSRLSWMLWMLRWNSVRKTWQEMWELQWPAAANKGGHRKS